MNTQVKHICVCFTNKPGLKWELFARCITTVSARHRSVAERNNDCGLPVVGLEDISPGLVGLRVL